MFKKDMALGEMNARSANKRRLSVVTEKRTRKIFFGHIREEIQPRRRDLLKDFVCTDKIKNCKTENC